MNKQSKQNNEKNKKKMDNQLNQKELPLLSVIVRAFNIEKELLDKCILSVVQQTYTNIEIMLVNNASTDDTGLYCDAWLQKDSRIKVLHSQKGLRTLEILKHATGDYVHTLDHDDWIAPEMYANMMSAMLSTNSDIARCEFCKVYPDGRIEQRNIIPHTDGYEIISRKETVLLLMENKKWQAYYWQNIYKRELFDHYVPPKIKHAFGDIAKTHYLFHLASKIVYLHDVYYFYYQRPGSIVNQKTKQGRKRRDYLRGNAIYARYLFVKQYPEYHSILPTLKKEATVFSIFSLWDMIDYPQNFPENAYAEQVERLKQFSLSLQNGMYFVLNLDLFILKKLPRCYKFFYKLSYRNIRRIMPLRNYVLKKLSF